MEFSVLALPIFPVRVRIVAALKNVPGGRKGAPPVAESSDRSGWAAACLGASKAKREGLAATRTVLGRKKPQPFG